MIVTWPWPDFYVAWALGTQYVFMPQDPSRQRSPLHVQTHCKSIPLSERAAHHFRSYHDHIISNSNSSAQLELHCFCFFNVDSNFNAIVEWYLNRAQRSVHVFWDFYDAPRAALSRGHRHFHVCRCDGMWVSFADNIRGSKGRHQTNLCNIISFVKIFYI